MCLLVRKFVLGIMTVLVLFQNFSVSEVFLQMFASFNFVELFLKCFSTTGNLGLVLIWVCTRAVLELLFQTFVSFNKL